jgi:hypothetical protein
MIRTQTISILKLFLFYIIFKSKAIKSEIIFGKIIQLCSSSNNVVQHPKQLPIVLMPSSYDLAAKNHPDEEGCVNIILVCGSLVLLGTISAIVALIFGLIWRNSEQIDDERLVHVLYLQYFLTLFGDHDNLGWK